MKIATLAFGSSTQTLGLSVVLNSVKRRFPQAEIRTANHQTAHEADYLLVSLYWWKDVYEFLWWLSQLGIDPRKRRPVIIIGGMSVANPRPLHGYYHYAILGDGEACICDVLQRLESGEEPYGIDGVYSPDGCRQAVAPSVPADVYVEHRKSKITRIELARGCRSRCPFCQLAYTKPYREQPFTDVANALRSCETNQVALFAPNRTDYSRLADVDALVVELGKNNIGSDTRLDMVRKFKRLDCVRFGVEGFSERTRRKFHKTTTRKAVVDGLVYVATELQNLHGDPMRSATCYMIGDLPGETREDVDEFWDTLAEVDGKLTGKFTLFLSVSSFVPSPHTPMWGCGIHPYMDRSLLSNFGLTVGGRGGRQFRNLVIACRGGLAPAPARIAQMLTIRGDERCARVLHWLATKGQRVYTASGRQATRAGKQIEKVLDSVGYPATELYEGRSSEAQPPWHMIEPTVTYTRRWD